jgi:hypothetical protein
MLPEILRFEEDGVQVIGVRNMLLVRTHRVCYFESISKTGVPDKD